jgi:hypothetical protein
MVETLPDAQELARLGQSLNEAEIAFLAADEAKRIASRNQTAALNRLTDHQKKFDAFIEKLKAASPAGGIWKQSPTRQRLYDNG